MSTVEELGLTASLAQTVGVPEAAFRLLLTLFAGYPIAFVYRSAFSELSFKPLHHIFFALCGFGFCIFNYGFDTYHSLVAIWVTYLLIRLLHNSTQLLLIINFIFHMSYLLIGYYFTESNDYDILWTMPHCVLALRMIGFGFDVADGRKPREKLSKEQLETALEELPTLLELSAYAYFPCSFLIGPQFPYRRYKRFIDGEFRKYSGAVQAGMKRLCVGLLYLTIRQVGAMYVPDSYFLTDAFRNQPFIWRLLFLGLWAKLSLYKYISCWLITEGALMALGFSYNGQTPEGKPDWSGCSNVKLMLLEKGYAMQHYVLSFNVNTNQWVAQYVYKRLRFLNNRTISYAAALGFLAVWHGFHSGYYVAFLIEYMVVTSEKQIETIYKKSVVPSYSFLSTFTGRSIEYFVLKVYDFIYMGWCLTPFIFLSYPRYIQVMSATNYFGLVFVVVWFIIYKLYQMSVRSAQRDREEHAFSRATTLSPTVESENVKQD